MINGTISSLVKFNGKLVGDEITQEAIMGCIMAHNRKEEVEA